MHCLASWTISITVIHVLHTVIVEFGPERSLIVNSPLCWVQARDDCQSLDFNCFQVMTAYPCHHEWTAALQLFKVITSIKLLIDFINSLISYGFSSTKAKIMTNLNSQRCFLVDMFHNVDVVEFAFEKKLIPTLFDVSKPKAFDKKITPRLCSFMTNTLALHCDFLKIY